MYIGIIASRYAKALYEYTEGRGSAEQVYRQCMYIVFRLPRGIFSEMSAPVISADQKLLILKTALARTGGGELHGDLEHFIRLVIARHRDRHLIYILVSFAKAYRDRNAIFHATLKTPFEPSEQFKESLCRLVLDGCSGVPLPEGKTPKVEIEVTVDPSLIGGFVFVVNDHRVDTSISAQLNKLRKAFEINNKRIV
ncbi:MAG: F0F1 ATP synthase subunit delta [Bacteroidales bacterium]|nr:F0F1 ATP synthase subunit delta [Bacteroidales bacterium]